MNQKNSGVPLGSNTPRRPAFREGDTASALASKMVEGLLSRKSNNRSTDNITPPNAMVAHLANTIAANTVDAENMIQLLPDMELAKQVLISSILSPVDMVSTELTYSSNADALHDVKTLLVEAVHDYFENEFGLTSKLAIILEEILFTKGAYIWIVLPESSIDDAINSNSRISQESFSDVFDRTTNLPKSLGLLGNPDHVVKNMGAAKPNAYNQVVSGFGIESFFDTREVYRGQITSAEFAEKLTGLQTMTFVSDNYHLLKLPQAYRKLVNDRVSAAVAGENRVSMESIRNTLMDDKKVKEEPLYRPRQFDYKAVLRIKTLDELTRETIGHPVVINAPVESLIPIHSPSEPTKHICYFMVIDNHGNPIRAMATRDYYADFAYNAANMREMSSQLLSNGRRSTEGRRDMNDMMMFEEASRCYAEIIEEDLQQRLKNGLYGDNLKISHPEEIYKMMFARACSQMHTQLVLIPASLVTYCAFDYSEFGVGKSLTESTKILGAIRAILLFANTMAAVKNSINHTKLNVKFDPDDPDPDYTISQAIHGYTKSRFASFPLGVSNPNDIVTYINNAGVSVETEGHPNYPDTKVDISNFGASHTMVSTELDDSLKKRHMMAFNVAPETVELSMGVDFATSVVNSNILLAKRSMRYQEKLTPFLEDFMRKFIMSSKTLMTTLTKILEDNKSKLGLDKGTIPIPKVLTYFIDSLQVALPAPDLKRLETQMTAFENYSKSLDTTLPAFIAQEMFDSSTVGDLSNSIAVTTAILKAYYQRRWLEENGVMGELFELVTSSDNKDGAFNLLRQHQQYLEGLGASTLEFMKLAGKFVYKSNKAIQEVQAKYGTTDSGGGDSGGGDSGDDGSGGGGDDTGDDADNGDFNPDGGGDDAGGGEDTGGSGGEDAGDTGDEDNGDFDAGDADKGDDADKAETSDADADKKEDDADNGDFKG